MPSAFLPTNYHLTSHCLPRPALLSVSRTSLLLLPSGAHLTYYFSSLLEPLSLLVYRLFPYKHAQLSSLEKKVSWFSLLFPSASCPTAFSTTVKALLHIHHGYCFTPTHSATHQCLASSQVPPTQLYSLGSQTIP